MISTGIIISLVQFLTHSAALIYLKLIKYKKCSFDQNMLNMLYLYELIYFLTLGYGLLEYVFDEKSLGINIALGFLFPLIYALIMVIVITFIFELRRLSQIFSYKDLSQY